MNKADLPPLTLIAGPTASGKSALAMRLAAERPSVIVNADAMQVYADLRVLTARPSAEEEAAVPHRLFGHVDGATACSAADWAAQARGALADIWAAGLHPILVGGTGLYIRTLLDGIAPVPAIDPALRSEVRALDVADAHAALALEDPHMAARLRPSDTTRVARALEVMRSTGRSLSDWQSERVGGIAAQISLNPLILDPPREDVVRQSDSRVEAMLAGGAIEEVAALRARTLDPNLPVMRAIGVPPVLKYLSGELTHDQAVEQISMDTRAYIKRQQTWMRGQFPGDWPRLVFVPKQDG
ncbi:tRNA dimethylallyltransferase [Sphingomonas antarctica]|uniref:tRNA (adenosine(37)-N6)-dimethylallyltransferase MiaA n=1 Tax=Sphingomonas antarctica TaxID=2040274 RepID=UPI0039ED2C0A